MGKVPAEGLRPDTQVALSTSSPGLEYIGVWAPDAEACASVDQAGARGYVVITPDTLRRTNAITRGSAAPLTDGTVMFNDVQISMPTADSIVVGDGELLVRCAR